MYNTIYIARVQVQNVHMYIIASHIIVHIHVQYNVHCMSTGRKCVHASYVHQSTCTYMYTKKFACIYASNVHAYMYNTYTCTLYCMHVPYMYMYTIIRVITSLKLSF